MSRVAHARAGRLQNPSWRHSPQKQKSPPAPALSLFIDAHDILLLYQRYHNVEEFVEAHQWNLSAAPGPESD